MRTFPFLAALALVTQVCWAGPINRCEASDGRVVYSDEPCPSGTHRMRTVDEKPAVEVLKPAAEAHAQDAKSAGSLRRAPAEPTADRAHDQEAASEIRKLKLAECDDLVRRVEYAQRDLNAAAEGERASAELSLRRLQAEHEAKCAKQR
jgi:hypothetical protein